MYLIKLYLHYASVPLEYYTGINNTYCRDISNTGESLDNSPLFWQIYGCVLCEISYIFYEFEYNYTDDLLQYSWGYAFWEGINDETVV